jgi:hypothetical protein
MIKKLVTIAALAMLLGSPASYAEFVQGNELVEYCDESNIYDAGICFGYVIGVSDSINVWAGSDSINGKVACIPDGVTVRQVMSIFKKYLKENPEEHHLRAQYLIGLALMKAFPCD